MVLKILFISHSSKFYGAENSLLDLLSHLDRKRFELYLVCPREGILSEKAQEIRIKTFFIKHKPWITGKTKTWKQFCYIPFYLFSIFNTIKIAKNLKIDLIYTNTSTIIHGAVAAKILSIPHIWHIRETLGITYASIFGNKILLKIVDYFSSKIILNSRNTHSFFNACKVGKTEIIYNGIDINHAKGIEEISKNTSLLMQKYSLNKNDTLIGMCGNIHDGKGQKELILAMPIILKSIPDTKLLIVGDDSIKNNPYCSEIKDLCNNLNLNANVIFTGFQKDMIPIYSILNLLVLLSNDEPFGRVLIEAMSYKIPVIATNVGGVKEIIKNEVNGILIDSREPTLVANTVVNLLKDKDKMSILGNEGRKTVIDFFEIKKSIQAIENSIINLCS